MLAIIMIILVFIDTFGVFYTIYIYRFYIFIKYSLIIYLFEKKNYLLFPNNGINIFICFYIFNCIERLSFSYYIIIQI